MSGERSRAMMRLAFGVALTAALGGCVQATRHSNAIVFGTNTSLGVNVGPNATSIPSINVGYHRQEAVFMPVVANTREAPRRNGAIQPTLAPCDVTAEVRVADGAGASNFAVHPCILLANRGGATDSYSVLASFGGRAGGSGGASAAPGDPPRGSAEARITVAQYFATGIAAQLLAVTGGAALVSTGADEPDQATVQQALAAPGNPDQLQRSVVSASQYRDFKSHIGAKIAREKSDESMITQLEAFEGRFSPLSKLSSRCRTRLSCLSLLAENNETPFSEEFADRPSILSAALELWPNPQ